MDQTPKLTAAHTRRMRELIASTHDGQAHWAGTGPQGETCISCKLFILKRLSAKDRGEADRQGLCSKYAAMKPKARKTFFSGWAEACRFYERGEKPPSLVPWWQKPKSERTWWENIPDITDPKKQALANSARCRRVERMIREGLIPASEPLDDLTEED